MKCFYHSEDLDGIASCAVVKLAYPDCEVIGFNYGQKFPWEKIDLEEKIFMVDVSLPAKDMERLHMIANLVWIDHHATAIKEIGALRGKQEVGYAACELTYMHIHDLPLKSVPRALRLLGRYDVWDHDYHIDVLPFQYGMRAIKNMSPEHPVWKTLLLGDDQEEVAVRCMAGYHVMDYIAAENAKLAPILARRLVCFGKKCIAINRPKCGSRGFADVYDPKQDEIMITWHQRSDGIFEVSLYTDREDIDVGTIAKQNGGGGHKRAAGFTSNNIIFLTKS